MVTYSIEYPHQLSMKVVSFLPSEYELCDWTADPWLEKALSVGNNETLLEWVGGEYMHFRLRLLPFPETWQ
jgi:hypothetical protein